MNGVTGTDMFVNKIPSVELQGGISMPQIGYGVFEIKDHDKCKFCVREAIHCGYRMFDTASAYFNEDAVGEAVAEAIAEGLVRREDIFLTTKVWLQDYGTEATRASIERSLKKLQTDYLDLVLLHQPFGAWQQAWQTLEQLQEEGSIRAIGTSNFSRKKIEELLLLAKTKPQVDQIEMHPFYSENELSSWLLRQGIQPEAWGPLNEGQRGIFRHPVLTRIGKTHGKSAAQVALRWNLQKGRVVIPKGTSREHMKENLCIFDFHLDPGEMAQIDALDVGHSEIIDFENPATERLLTKWKIHA